MSGGLHPDPEAIVALHRSHPRAPLALVELVTFAAADGRQRYRELWRELGGRVVFGGSADLWLIGEEKSVWDDVLVVELGSRAELVARMASPPPLTGLLARRRSYAARPGPRALLAALRLARPFVKAWARPHALPLEEARAAAAADPTPRGLGPRPEQVEALLAGDPRAPVVMLNLLAYRARAHYAETRPDGDVSGAAAYRRYARGVMPLVLGAGGRPVWLGRAESVLVGEAESWDELALVEYPSRGAFLGMATSPAYRAVARHRDAGLARTALLQCTPWPEFGGL